MQVISFFSYKGGSGRTSLLYNTVPFLADEFKATSEEPIIILDLDIDSKGLSFLLKGPNGVSSDINALHVLNRDAIITGCSMNKAKFFEKMLPVGKLLGLGEARESSVLFISANNITKYMQENTFDSKNFELDYFVAICARMNCKALILDNPAGAQLSGDLALSVSDKIVTVMRITRQFREGTVEFIREAGERFSGKQFIIVPNVVPRDSNNYSIEKILKSIEAGIKDVENDENEYNLDLFTQGNRGINEVNLFKFEEVNLRRKLESGYAALEEDENRAMEMYKKLAWVLADENS